MSGISEIDIRDFRSLDIKQARHKLDKAVGEEVKTYAQHEAVIYLENFFDQLEKAQTQIIKQVPALFKPKGKQ